MGKGLATVAMWGACACAVIFSDNPYMGCVFIGAMLGTLFMWG